MVAQPLQALSKPVLEHGLQQVVHGGEFEGADCIGGVGSHEDHRRTVGDLRQHLHPVGAGHLDVQEDHVHIMGLAQPVEQRQAIPELTDNCAFRFLE